MAPRIRGLWLFHALTNTALVFRRAGWRWLADRLLEAAVAALRIDPA